MGKTQFNRVAARSEWWGNAGFDSSLDCRGTDIQAEVSVLRKKILHPDPLPVPQPVAVHRLARGGFRNSRLPLPVPP